jgi:HAD superfamily hydrolase (TIGR01509 family)
MAPPPGDASWDQAAAATHSEPDEVRRIVDAYSLAFVDGMPPVPGVDELLGRLAAGGRRLAILSNWPLAATVERYAEARGWDADLVAIVVSQRVGVIKPHPAIFEAARAALGNPAPAAILHVGDDWAADVVGAADAGWRTAWVTVRPADTPLPTSDPDPTRRHAIGHSPHWSDPTAMPRCGTAVDGGDAIPRGHWRIDREWTAVRRGRVRRPARPPTPGRGTSSWPSTAIPP